MNYDPLRHHRRSIRLKGYDYSQAGAYFVTIVTHDRECAFGEVVECEMRLNEIGQVASECWVAMPTHHSNIELDEFVVMPNHIHGIILIVADGHGDARRGVQLNAPTDYKPTRNADNRMSVISPYRGTLSVVIRTFKAAVTTAAREINRQGFAWQRNYHEHIIRNDRDLERIRAYILNNPPNWHADAENPSRGVQLNASQTP